MRPGGGPRARRARRAHASLSGAAIRRRAAARRHRARDRQAAGCAAVRRADRRARIRRRASASSRRCSASTRSSGPPPSSSRTTPASRTSPTGCCSSPTARSPGSTRTKPAARPRRADLVRHAALDIKLFRDVRRLWAQVLAIALVVGGGVATLVLAVGSHRSLEETRDRLLRALRLRRRLRRGEARAEGAGRPDRRDSRRCRGRCAHRQAGAARHTRTSPSRRAGSSFRCRIRASRRLNRLYMRSADCPSPGRPEEVVVNEPFARAHGFARGCALFGDPERQEARTVDRRNGAVAGVHLHRRAGRPHAGRPALRDRLDVREGARQRLRSRRRVLIGRRQAAARRVGARGHPAARCLARPLRRAGGPRPERPDLACLARS